MQILLVDDDHAVRTSIRLVLKANGFEVIKAENGAVGLEKAAKAKGISLVLVDLLMPDVNGFKLISELRSTLPSVPIIAMSGSIARVNAEVPDEFKAAIELGATTTIHKPFRPHELVSTIKKVLGR
jgi:DNA-binding response OmpR family regulator